MGIDDDSLERQAPLPRREAGAGEIGIGIELGIGERRCTPFAESQVVVGAVAGERLVVEWHADDGRRQESARIDWSAVGDRGGLELRCGERCYWFGCTDAKAKEATFEWLRFRGA